MIDLSLSKEGKAYIHIDISTDRHNIQAEIDRSMESEFFDGGDHTPWKNVDILPLAF